jgi:hypothetical protein
MNGWLTPVAAFAAFCLALRFRRIKKTIPKARAPRIASPPITPPTIAPMFDFLAGFIATEAPLVVGLAVADSALLAVLLSVVVLASTVESTVDEGSSETLETVETAASDGGELVVVPSVNVRWTEIVKPEDAQPYSVMTVRLE